MATSNPGPRQQKPTDVNPNYPTGQKPTQNPTEQINNAMNQPAPAVQPTTTTQPQTPIQQINSAMKVPVAPGTHIDNPRDQRALSAQAASTAKTTQEATGGLYQVNANGQLPQNLKVGDQVVMANGTYTVTGVNPDGTYKTKLTNKAQTTATMKGQPTYAAGYDKNMDYTAMINKALANGDLAAAAYYEDLRNKKIQGEGLQGQYALTNNYAQYLSQLTPERQAQLMSGYARDTTAMKNPGDKMGTLLEQWRAAAEQQAAAKVDYATQQGITELERARDDAQPMFQKQLDQNDIDSAKAASNSALYAEARGDRGGIGQSQYNEILAAQLKNRQTIETARTKLATDTARQIADLRSKGEFEKADQLLTIAQKYLTQAMELEQWNAQYAMSQEEMARELEQWQANHALQVANITGVYDGKPTFSAQKYDQETAAELAKILWQLGKSASPELLAAAGYSQYSSDVARIANAMGSGFSGGGSSGGGSGSSYTYTPSPNPNPNPNPGGGGPTTATSARSTIQDTEAVGTTNGRSKYMLKNTQ